MNQLLQKLTHGGKALLPRWAKHYSRPSLGSDIWAGMMTSVLVLPQNLAYALLAGLPPQAGLWVSIFPVIAYALWGSSMTQAVGPVAVTAIVTFSVLTPLAPPFSTEYLLLAASLALLSGLMVLAFGVFKLGFLSDLLSRPVVSGFISGSAILILIHQFNGLLGLEVHSHNTWQLLSASLQALPQFNPVTTAIGLIGLGVLLFARHLLSAWLQRLGFLKTRADFVVRLTPLLVVMLATVVVIVYDLDHQFGVAVVGAIPKGLPEFAFALPTSQMASTLVVPALVVAFIGTVQNIGMAQALAVKRRERLDANQELVGLGAANIVASFSGGMPVGGGISRTAVNLATGAKTPLASIVAALSMWLILLLGTTGFERMPLSILAASIVAAALGMIDISALRSAWRYDRADGAALLGTAAGVIVLGLQWGIALGIGLSLAALLTRASTPHMAVMGRITGTEHFRNVERHQVETLQGVLFLRIDESFFFGNWRAIELRMSQELQRQPEIHDLVLVMSAVNRIDMTALDALSELGEDLRKRGVQLHLAEVKGPVQDRLEHTAFWKNLQGRVHLSVNQAFESLRKPTA